jgi:nicotinamidase-related amidase
MLLTPPALTRIAAAQTAVVLIDAQHYAASRDRGLGAEAAARGIAREFDDYYTMAEAAVAAMARLVEAARARGALVVHTVVADTGALSRQFRETQLPLPTGDPASDIRPEVAPRAGESVLARGGYSCFLDGALERALAARGISRVVLCGMFANLTVAFAAREAAERGYEVIVVQDACASETFDWHAATMLGIAGGLIRVQWVDEVKEMLEGKRT